MGGASSPDPVPLSSQKAQVRGNDSNPKRVYPARGSFLQHRKARFTAGYLRTTVDRQRRQINFAADRSWIYRVIPLIRRRLRVSCLIQPQKTARLKLYKCRALPSPQAPASVRYQRGHTSWGLFI